MTGGEERSGKWWHAPLRKLYKSLVRSDIPAPVDLIFVMAGRMSRKPYGLELYRAGLAPRLVLGVGRFEVSKMYNLGLENALVDELIALRNRTLPAERHFFVKMEPSGVSIEKRFLPQWSTYGEILDLRDFLEVQNLHTVMIVSTDIHLRRVALTCARVFRDAPVEVLYCPVPPRFGPPLEDGWSTRADDRRFVIKEVMKLAGYGAILSLPASISRRLMRLKSD